MSDIVVADAGPLHNLILIDCAGALRELFARVLIPPVLREEALMRRLSGRLLDRSGW